MSAVFDIPELNDPKVAEKVKKAIQDISDQMTILEGYKATIREGIKAIAEDNDIPKKTIRWLANTYHKQLFQTVVEENDVHATAYTKVFGDD